MAGKIKRGVKPRKTRAKAKPRRGAKVRRVSMLDKLIKALPLNDRQLQKAMTWGIVGVALIGSIVAAQLTGVTAKAHEQYAQLASRAGFEVKRVEVTGIERVDELKVYDLVLAEKDRAMPLVDVSRIRSELLRYGWIDEARVSRRLPDTLVVEIIEREPAAVWQQGEQLSLIDAKGNVLEEITPDLKPDLPMLVGEAANRRAVELADLLDAAPALKPQIVGAHWIGDRRWDLTFKTGETLALPEGREASAAALVKFARMDGVNRLLGQNIIHFDFRDPKQAYLRPRPKPVVPDGNDGEEG